MCSGSCIFHERRLPVKVSVEFSNEETPALFITYNYQLFVEVSSLSRGKIHQRGHQLYWAQSFLTIAVYWRWLFGNIVGTITRMVSYNNNCCCCYIELFYRVFIERVSVHFCAEREGNEGRRGWDVESVRVLLLIRAVFYTYKGVQGVLLFDLLCINQSNLTQLVRKIN